MLCNFENCKKKISIIGHCNYCFIHFCNTHRHIELHDCKCLKEIKKDKVDLLKKSLIKIVPQKIVLI